MPHGVAVAASVLCLVWGKAEPAIRPSGTILHDALNGQTASSDPVFYAAPAERARHRGCINTHVHCIQLIGWVTQRVLDDAGKAEPRPSPFTRSVIARARAECNYVWANSAKNGEGQRRFD